jgi:hypothetical protein
MSETQSPCERIHEGDVVRIVVVGLGFMQYGLVTLDKGDDDYVVTFADGVAEDSEITELSYTEAELEKMSA